MTLLISLEEVDSRVRIDRERGVLTSQDRSLADLGTGSSGRVRVVRDDEIETVRWTYRQPDGDNAELGRVDIDLIDERVVTLGWGSETGSSLQMAQTIADLAGVRLQCFEQGTDGPHQSAMCVR